MVRCHFAWASSRTSEGVGLILQVAIRAGSGLSHRQVASQRAEVSGRLHLCCPFSFFVYA